ncbi:MAG: hypothetical protein L0Z55_05575 [Planctomycetes bacterium]|nr:hypothetical protein [Planctomycetota bacterium]
MSSETRMFGDAALEKGYVTTAQLYQALSVQARREAENLPHRFLGEILIELGYMTERQVLDLLNAMHHEEPDTVHE